MTHALQFHALRVHDWLKNYGFVGEVEQMLRIALRDCRAEEK